MAVSAEQFLDGLLVNERRKTGWMRAEAAGDLGSTDALGICDKINLISATVVSSWRSATIYHLPGKDKCQNLMLGKIF